MFAEAGLPQPYSVEHELRSIFLYRHEHKLVIEVADIALRPPGAAPESPPTGGGAASPDG